MDGDGFDVWGSQPSASGPATHAGLDLNSQAPVSEGFPWLGLYGAFLQSDDDELLPGRVRGSGLPPYRPTIWSSWEEEDHVPMTEEEEYAGGGHTRAGHTKSGRK
uniref:Uncharacterized protein n=1 Tax=Aegilops tauschii TaxID=37682 RepID=N1QSI1_AEGTA